MTALLAILGIILVVFGVARLIQGALLWGIVLIIIGLIIAPGGLYFG
ncbi:MAG: hypothetical protein KY462_14550 [Actinobacteria bacterium]|nr:hypothetical protein [Actinomycetota bacterium]